MQQQTTTNSDVNKLTSEELFDIALDALQTRQAKRQNVPELVAYDHETQRLRLQLAAVYAAPAPAAAAPQLTLADLELIFTSLIVLTMQDSSPELMAEAEAVTSRVHRILIEARVDARLRCATDDDMLPVYEAAGCEMCPVCGTFESCFCDESVLHRLLSAAPAWIEEITCPQCFEVGFDCACPCAACLAVQTQENDPCTVCRDCMASMIENAERAAGWDASA